LNCLSVATLWKESHVPCHDAVTRCIGEGGQFPGRDPNTRSVAVQAGCRKLVFSGVIGYKAADALGLD